MYELCIQSHNLENNISPEYIDVSFEIHFNDTIVFVFADNDFDEVEIFVTRYKPERLDALCKTTKFSRKEIRLMYQGFKQVKYLTFFFKMCHFRFR